jgi:hypothetical protein
LLQQDQTAFPKPTSSAAEYFKQGGPAVDLVACWDRFSEDQKNQMVKFGKEFVEKGINDMTDRWLDDTEVARQVRETLTSLRTKLNEISVYDLATDYMPGWGWDIGWTS